MATKIACSIRARSLQRRLFRAHLEKADCDHFELLLHTDVRWLSRGKLLKRFRELCPEIKKFFRVSGRAEYKQLNDGQWLIDLAFLTDLTNLLNDLNLELQEKDKTMTNMISSLYAFKQTMQHFSTKLQRHDLANFRNLASSWRRKGRPVSNLTVHATRRSPIVCQNLANAFKTFLCLSQLLLSCAVLFRKMLRLIHSHQTLHHCFT